MGRFFHSVFSPSGQRSGRKLFLHNAVVLLLFFSLSGLYKTGFPVCLLAFLAGQAFLLAAELLYRLLAGLSGLIREVAPWKR